MRVVRRFACLLLAVVCVLPMPWLRAAETATAPAILIRGGILMTMAKGDNTTFADLLIRDGRIAAIGQSLEPPEGAKVIDAAGQFVLPGFVDVHSHLSIYQMRGLYRNTAESKFFPVTNRLAAAYTPDDIYIGMLMASLESVDGGVTTTVDFFDNVRSRDHAEAGLKALRDSPIRARLLYGAESKTTRKSIDLDHLREWHDRWNSLSPDGRTSLGLAWRLPRDLDDSAAWEIKMREYKTAQELGLPIAVHVSGNAHAMFDALIERELIFPGLQVVHATDARPEQLTALARMGGSLALTPLTEHRVGYGLTLPRNFSFPPRQGLGIDGHALAGTASMFEIMRFTALNLSGADRDELRANPRRLLEVATRQGAESLGLGDEIGTLEVGKKADILIIDPGALNLGLWNGGDPSALIVYSARPDNVSTVIIDGRLVKEYGKLLGYDLPTLLEKSRHSIEKIQQRAEEMPSQAE